MSTQQHTCRQVFEKLDDYMDRVLTTDEIASIEHHLERCTDCASEFRFEESLISEIKAKLRRIDLPPDLMSRIVQRLRAEGESDDC